MVQWDFSLDSVVTDSLDSSRRSARRISTSRRKKTASRPLVELKPNSHLLHAGRSKTSLIKNGKKIRIRRVKK